MSDILWQYLQNFGVIVNHVEQAKVHFIAGKGGVGKTLLSLALARFFALRHKTLLVELSEEETPEKETRASINENIATNLSYIKIFPDQAIYEYLALKIQNKTILNSLLAQNLFRSLCSAMPGLFDLTRLGKIWFHADAAHGAKGEIYDRIVVDMPSTGFVNRFLTIARVVHEAVRIGPLAKEAKSIDDYFKDSTNALLHLVAIPEELVVNETILLFHEIRKSSSINLGSLFLNRVFDEKNYRIKAPSDEMQRRYPLLFGIASAFFARVLEEEKQRKRFIENGIMLPQITFQEQMGEMVQSKIIDYMVREFSDS